MQTTNNTPFALIADGTSGWLDALPMPVKILIGCIGILLALMPTNGWTFIWKVWKTWKGERVP
jgi:hypothetical protein